MRCLGSVRIPLELKQGNRPSFRNDVGNTGTSQVVTGNSGYLSSCDRDLGAPIEFQQESQASSCLVAWNSTFLLSCKRGVRPPVELRQGTRAFSRGATGESDLPSCCEGKLEVSFKSLQGIQAFSQVEGELCGFSTCGRNLGVPFELQ